VTSYLSRNEPQNFQKIFRWGKNHKLCSGNYLKIFSKLTKALRRIPYRHKEIPSQEPKRDRLWLLDQVQGHSTIRRENKTIIWLILVSLEVNYKLVFGGNFRNLSCLIITRIWLHRILMKDNNYSQISTGFSLLIYKRPPRKFNRLWNLQNLTVEYPSQILRFKLTTRSMIVSPVRKTYFLCFKPWEEVQLSKKGFW